ncbi:hypothetical protein BASA83_012726 [Batrachochytrium salamandrivorans]|nr:hypothetical protein BASA83_012726 [Batrachochytrium salamandrivorans]
MFSCLKTWSEYALKVFEPCGISSLSEGGFDMAIFDTSRFCTPTTNVEHLHTTTVTKMNPMMAPIVARSQIIQAPQPSVYLPNDPDRIYSESDIIVESVPMAIIHTPKIKEKMDSGVDIAKELYPIKDFAYDNSDQFIFKSYMLLMGYTTYQPNVSSYTIKAIG